LFKQVDYLANPIAFALQLFDSAFNIQSPLLKYG